MNIPKVFVTFFDKFKVPRYRDRRGHYASSALQDSRELYWELTGVPATNETDYVGNIRMRIGKWIEVGISKDILANLHFFGLHLVGNGEAQIPVGGSTPAWDGYLDMYVCERTGDKFNTPIPLELKCKFGFGADMLCRNPAPSDDHLAQLGLYCKDLHEKGQSNEGILLYFCMSDGNMGELLQFDVRYDPQTQDVIAHTLKRLDGSERPVNFRLNLKTQVFERWARVEKAVAEKKAPPKDYHYKRELTPEFLATQSDYALGQALKGEKILGDWQPRYSRYFDLILKTDNQEREYSQAELAIIKVALDERKKVKAAERKAARVALKVAASQDFAEESEE